VTPSNGADASLADASRNDVASTLAADATTDSTAEPPSPSADELRALPRYAAKLPPSRTQRFRVRSGAHEGEGELRWQRDGDHYETTLHTRGDQLTRIDWVSHGATGEHGTAPERMATRRRGRDTAVAYFQPAMGVVTFSRAVVRQPHTDGAQDRLSWLVQLAAIVDADPARRSAPGEPIDLYVIGPRGDAQVWRFEAHGAEAVATDTGAVQALKFTRRASRPYDHDIELWLDPARGHWPLRFRWQLRGTRQPPLIWDRLDAP
jgi:hypothetical protein